MNTLFIRLFFSLICLYILFYVFSFSLFEIKNRHNILGGVFSFLITFSGVIFCNIIFWIN